MGEKSRLRTKPLHIQHHDDSWIERVAHGWKESSSDNAPSFLVPRGIFVGFGAWPMGEKSRLRTTPLHSQRYGDSGIERMAQGGMGRLRTAAHFIVFSTRDIRDNWGVAFG